MIESRRWKHAFSGVDVESPLDLPRVELTPTQKAWLVRAWTYCFGFVPNAIPIYNEEEGFAHRPGISVQWHHVEPIGEVTRIHGESSRYYNDPRRLVPVSAVNHIGSHASPDDFVVHEDTMEAFHSFGEFKEGRAGNPFIRMGEERRRLTDAGLPYHNTAYDGYLLQLAEWVTETYRSACPEDLFPVYLK